MPASGVAAQRINVDSTAPPPDTLNQMIPMRSASARTRERAFVDSFLCFVWRDRRRAQGTQTWRRVGGDPLQPEAEHTRRLVEMQDRHAVQKRLQDLRSRHGGPARRHGQRRGLLPRSLQKVVPGHGLRHAGRNASRLDSRRPLAEPTPRLTPKQLGESGRLTRPLYLAPDEKTYRVISLFWDEALDKIAAKLQTAGPRSEHSSTPAAEPPTKPGFLPQLLAAAVRHELRQQLLLLLPPGERRRAR